MSDAAPAPRLCLGCGIAPATWLGQCRTCARMRVAQLSIARPRDAEDVEDVVLRVVEEEIGRVLHEYAEGGRDSKVIRKVHVGLRLALRRHFAGEGEG